MFYFSSSQNNDLSDKWTFGIPYDKKQKKENKKERLEEWIENF